MLRKHVALIDRSGTVGPAELAEVAAALSVQVSRDLCPFWQVDAIVQALPVEAGVPVGVWPMFLEKDLPPDEGGFHLTKYNQPYAKVASGEGWTIAASHEILEMLVDPSGNRTHAAPAIGIVDGKVQDIPGMVEYLVEVSDPSEAPDHGYTINGVLVSDFYTPHYFDAAARPGVRYSFTGALTAPRQVLKWGYLAWHDPLSDALMQLDYVTEDPARIKPMVLPQDKSCLRRASDASLSTRGVTAAQARDHPFVSRARAHRSVAVQAADARRQLYP